VTGWTVFAVPILLAAVTPETFNLDIAEKRITENGFHASKALEVWPGEGGIHIQAGASISARTIELVLRNVRGTVHFHADTSRLQGTRPIPNPTPSTPPTIN
jgi:hypothetical protein